ncbi:titin isoform X6 [Musca domestica]|uniref:Titin isoform X6 n=1 Tax=Musca domestica TaxID=7370 RepID=A0ABM3UVT5_MUSDO|nr:titin isoform X6 [Musca domestica]
MFVSIDRIGCVVVVVVAAVVRLYVCQCCCRRHTYTVTSPIEATTTAPSAPTPTSQPTYCNRPASPSASQSHQPPTFSSVNAGFSNFSVILVLDRNWQQSEDINRKKEIRSQLYKLRESRLRDLYQFDIMADNNVAGFGKDPLAPSHGESFGDQSFQSLKSKEIRDSMSPSELKFQSMALNNPSSTGWNVQSSSEVTPDGRGFRAETIATTDGVEHINGGTAEFKGRNEQRSMAMQEGDDKNFVKKASESSNTHLQEKVVIGDENSGRTEIRTSSSTSTSSSKVFQSSSTTEYENDHPVDYHQPKYLMDSAPQRMQEPQQYQQRPSQAEPRYEPRYEPQYYDDHQQQQYTNQQTEQYQRNRQETNTSQNVQTNETREQNKRYVDMDKASPEYQQHVQYLMSQPGEIISNTVEYPKPNVKMITTVKRLPDGTIVRNKRYETEETTPTPAPSQTNTTTRQTVTNTNNTQRRDSQPTYQQPKNYQGQPPSERLRRPSDDVVDNAETVRRHTTTNDDTVETKYSTTKTSNRKFSTETTSETIHEYDDGYQVPSGGPRPKPVTNDFSTHGFPSVRPNKPTQEFANHRPQAMHPSQASPSQKMTSPPPREALIPVRSEYEPTVTERRIPTEDGEVIVVSSEKKRSVKHHTNSERIIETDIRTTDDNRYEQISDVSTSKTNQDFSTHGFPSVREPQQGQPPSRTSPDYSTQGFPSVRGPQSQPNAHPDYRPQPSGPMQPTGSVTKTIQTPDGEVIVTSQKSHTTKYNTNSERIIETEVLGDDGRPVRRIPVDVEYVSDKYTVTTPGDQVPQKGFPSVRSPTKPVADYSTPHGFPSTRYSHQKPSTPDYSTQGFPSTRDTHKPSTPDYSTQGFPSTRDGPQPSSTPERQYVSPVKTPTSSSKPSPTVEATERIIRKEKEVDSAHRAFAASLRSSSPVDQTRRDSYSTDGPRHTPRSSVSSTKPFRRDMREGSHDSETSRISTTTVTRQTPPRSVGGKTVVVTERVTSSSSPRGTKSPSPGKNVTTTTTTTTRTVTNKAPVKDVPKSDNHNHHQHTTTTSTTNNKNKNNNQKNTTFSSPSANETLSYPINPDSSLTITKKTVGDSQATKSHQLPLLSEVIEEPCIKKSYSLLGPCNRPPKTAASEQEPSPRSSPAPSSRSSPYPSSKSKTPLGEDDQKPPKSHTSRPFMPTSSPSSRSPQTDHDRSPIGYQDVRNSRDQQHPHPDRPRPHDNDEPKAVTREDTFEQVDIDRDTSTVVAVSQRKPSRDTPTRHQPDDEVFISEEDHVYEDIDSAVTRNVKTTTKQLITHEKQPGRTPQSGVRPVGETKRPARRNEPEKTTPLAPKSQQSPRTTPSTPTQSPRKSLSTSQPSKTPSPTKPSDKAPKQPGSSKQPSGDTRKPSKPEILKQTEVIKSKTTKYTEDYRQQSPEPKKKPEPRPSGKSPQEIKKHDEPKPNSKSPGRVYPLEDANEPKYTSPDYEYPSEDEEQQRKPSSKSPAREYPQSRPVGKSPQREDKPRNEYPGGRYPPGDQTNPKQQEQPGKPISKSPERRYPAEKPQSRPDDKSSKPGYQQPLQKPGKPEHPYDTEEEVERVTSEFTIKTTNKNLKTRQDIEFVIEDKPQSRPVGKSPQREYPDEKSPSGDATKPQQQKPGKPISKSPERRYADDKPKSRPDDKNSKPGHKQPSQESGKPGHPYDTDEERVTSEFTIITTNKNVRTHQDIEFVDEDKPQSRPTSKSPQRKYPHEDKPRNEYPDERYPSEDKTKPLQKQPGKPSHADDKTKSRPDDKSSKPGHKQPSQEHGKPGHPYDTDEERVTSEFTIITTNKNVKTRQDIEFTNEDKPQSRPSSKSPHREYSVSPDRQYPSGDRTKPKQQPGKPSDRSPQRTYPNEKPDDKSPTPDYPGDGSFKQPSQKPGKPQHPYDTEEEVERVTSEFTVKTTNQNVKTLEDIEFVVESKPHSRPSSKSPQRESPDRPYPSDDKTKPMTSGKPSDKSPQRTYPYDKPQSTPSGKSPKSGKPRPWEDAPLEPEHPYDVDEEERITMEMTIKTTNKNVKTRQDFDIHDENEEQLILTGKRPQKRYPYGDSDKPREESPNREYPLRDKVKPGEPSRKSPKRTHPHDELQFEQSDKSLKPDYPKKTQPGDKSPLEPEYPSDTEEEERHTSEVTVTKTSKTRKDIDILVEDETTLRTRKQTKEPKGQQPDTEEEDDEEPKFNDKKPTSRTPQSAKTKYPEQPDEPTSKTPKSTRPSLYETTAEKYIRNDDITTVTQKNVTTTIHDKFMDAERKYPTEEPQKPEDTKEPKAPRSETESTEPKKPLLNKDDKDFPSKSPEYPAEKKPTPKSTRPSLYETTAEKYIRNDDNRNVTQKTTTTTIHEQFIEAEQSPRKPKDFEPKASEPFSKAPQQPKDNDKEPKAKDSPQGKPEPEDQKPKVFEAKLADYPDRPQESYPKDKEPSSHYPEQPDDSKTVGYPGDKKPFSKLPKEAEPKDNEPIRKPTTKTTQTTTHEKFIEPQTTPAERPDGAFISKAPEEPAQYPSYIKKGTTRRDTFEDRCRQILGMESYGDTPGAYKKRPSKDVELEEEEDDKVTQKETVQKTTFEVKIEDCDDEDDEPLSINSVKKTLVTKKVPETKPQTKPRDMKPYEDDKPETTSESEPEVTYPDDEETLEVTTTETEFIDVTKKSPTETKKHPKGPKEYTTTTEEIYVTEVKKHQPDTTSDSEPETRETFKETIDVTKKRSEKTQVDVGKEPTSRSPTRPKSPTYDTRKPSSRSPQRYPEDITYQTEELTKESHIDIKKKVTSQSPTRPKSPTHETKKPSGRSPQRTPKDNSYEQVVVTTETTTRKPTSRSPMRTVSPTDEQKKPRSPSTSPQRRPKGPTYETTEVINERTETSRKPGSKSPTRPTYGEKKPSSTSPQRTPSSTSPQRTPKIYTSETEEVIIETTTRKSGSPVRPVSPFSKKPTSRSPTTSPQRTTKGSTYETVEVDKEITKKPSSRPKSPTYDTHKKPTSESPSRGPKSAALKPSKSPERPILTEDSEYESVIVTKQTDISKKTTSRSPTRVSELTPETPKKPSSRPKSPTYETQKKPISQSPTRGPKAAPHKPSKSPERATLTEDSQYETVVVSKQTDITKKTTSRSPTRMAEPKPSTVDSRKKPTSQSPSRGPKTTPSKTSKSPDRATLTEDSEYETVVVTEQTDVTKRVTSKSPTRFTEPRPERQPSKPTDTFTRPTAKKPQVKTNVNEEFITSEKVLVTKVKKDYPETTSESEPERPQPHEVSTKTIEITKKRNESSPTRRPEGSSPVYGSPKDRSYETIEVTNKRIETTKKPSSKSPTRPITDREPSSRVTKKTSTPTKPIAKPTMESPKQGPKTKPRGPTKSNITEEFITTEKVYVTGIEKDYPETTSDSEMEPQETYVETIEVTNKKKADKNIEITKKSVNKTPTKPSSEAPKKTPVKSTPSKDTKVVTETIKDRLRSSVRKDKPSPKKPDQVDAVSSPETSPNRLTERRRSSNISVNTEIIIEHTEHTAETATTKKTKDSVYKEIIDSTTLPEKLTRKMPVTERKESAPVHRVTRKDKDTKMSRSTSENLIKVQKKPEDDKPRILTPTADKKPTPKPTADHRRPNKCFATKTINLSATDRLMSSEDMENVIIDIQHAKSSREPSPDKIVPTPVPAHLDTGKPRYPDVVQEPEDEPKRKPVIKNIPIFEEENNSYVGCHISEASHRTFEDDDDSLCTPLVEAPSSLDYPSISETSYPTTTVVTDDECLLSVHDKVSRFQNIAEEVKKPKTSSPFHREFDDKTRVPDNDECLLSVDEKVDKFIKSAESLTTKQTTITTARDSKPKEFPGFNDDEDDLEVTECPFTTVKLAPSEPQKSPELVRHISRHISRQSDLGEPATEQQHTHRNETTMHEEFLSSQTTAEEFVTHRRDQTTSAVKQQPRRPVDRHDDDRDDEVYDEVHVNGDDDDEELIPHTAMHTVRLEERRQKDILARPSVFDNSKPRGGSTKPTPTPTKPTTATTPSTASRINKTQPRYVSPATKDSEKSRQSTPQQQRPQVKPKQSPKVTATATTTITSHTTTTTSAANKRQPHTQSPQQRRTHPDSDSDYRVGSHNKNETPVKSSTTIGKQKPKQQPVYGSINGPKKSPHSPQPVVGISVTVKKSPMHTAEQQRRSTTTTTNTSKNVKRSHVEVDEYEHEHDDDSDNVDYVEEFQVVEEVVPNDDSETELIINSDTTVRSTNSHQTKEETVKTKRATANNVRREPSTASPTSKSPATRPKMKETTPGSPLSTPSRSTKDHHSVDLTEKSTLHKHSTTNKSPSTTTTTTEPNESFLENRPPIKKTPGQTPYRPKTMITPTESVAARRSLFENHNNQATKPLARRPTPTSTSSSPSSGRRPSYMDHTKSSLEHIRRDSLEINKTNYTRRPSANDDDAPDRNSQVKFDVPQKPRSDVLDTDDSEYNIEEIFDLVILEKLLETVTSYEVRRRIRAQIRLVKKNMSNAEYTTVTTTSKRDNKTKPTSAQVISKKEEKQQQHYYYKEEHQRKERHSSTHTSPERVRTTQVTKVTTRRTESPDSKYSSPSEGRSVSPQSRLSQTRVCSRTHERSPSPSSVATEIKVKEVKKKQYENVEHVEEIYRESSPKIRKPKAYYPIDDDEEEVDTLSRPVKKTDVSEEYDSAELHEERTFKKETTHRRSSRKSISPQSSPERQKASSPRAGSPEGKKPLTSRVSPKSPERKTIITEQQQQQTLMTTKQQPKRTPVSAPLKSKPEPKAPVWADRKNILKSPSATPKKPSAVAPDSRISSSVSRTMKSSTQQQKVSSSTKSSYVEDDCITSSYGIGPTDENGLPLFGIRALKMKKPQQQQQPASEPICETTEEVTGYVVEEKYYSDNKSKPIVERKEIIYSTNPEELQAIKEKVRETATTTTTLKSLKHDKLESDDESPFRDNSTYKTKTITSVRSSPEEFLESSTTKYVRRGSVKEMSEKFLQKESASMVSEKTNNYPKAGLILRTNSRKQSRDNDDMDGENNEYYESRTSYRDTDEEDECRMVAGGEREYIVESESETESIKNTQREFKKITSTKSSSSSRSFLNTKGEEKIITGVDDVLDRMRNADNVVEEGDTAEDQEARALLNKFLGASIIMKGVESTIPTIPTVNRETKIITTTTTGVGSGRQPAKHEVKTTRVTKSIKSGSSSSPVIETTCDIEEIWDEEILKQLLEQAKTYEERRKIRSRLRELMADRADAKPQQSCTSTTEKTETKGKDGAVVTTTTKVTTRTVSGTGPKPVSPFAKFKQLDRQNSQQSTKSPTTPTTPGGGPAASPSATGNAPIFRFTDPSLNARAATAKEQLLQWCQLKTKEYENVQITNFSSSWVDGLAFCALIHHFLPDAFDYSKLTPQNRRENFELAFTVADEKAGIAPLLDVEDMVVMKRPDWKCVFVYVQSIYRRFRNCQ